MIFRRLLAAAMWCTVCASVLVAQVVPITNRQAVIVDRMFNAFTVLPQTDLTQSMAVDALTQAGFAGADGGLTTGTEVPRAWFGDGSIGPLSAGKAQYFIAKCRGSDQLGLINIIVKDLSPEFASVLHQAFEGQADLPTQNQAMQLNSQGVPGFFMAIGTQELYSDQVLRPKGTLIGFLASTHVNYQGRWVLKMSTRMSCGG